MATSKTRLVNRALIKLGRARLTSYEHDTSDLAVIARELFDECAEYILDQGPWTFALKRVELARLASTPTFEYTFEHQLPTDLIKIISLNNRAPGREDYRIEGDKLLSNDSIIMIKYVRMVDDVSKWTSSFKEAFVLKVAAEMSYQAKANIQLTDLLYQQLERQIKLGLSIDGQQGGDDYIRSSDLDEVR